MSNFEATVPYHASSGQHEKIKMVDKTCIPPFDMFLCAAWD